MQDAMDVTYEKEFEDRMRFYLSQPGHPEEPEIQLMVGESRYTREKNDVLVRARLLLTMMTGSDLVPVDPTFRLKVRIVLRSVHLSHTDVFVIL